MENQEQVQPEQVKPLVTKYRDEIINLAILNNYNYDVIFNALTQVIVGFVFELHFQTRGEVSQEAVDETLEKLAQALDYSAKFAFDALKQADETKE